MLCTSKTKIKRSYRLKRYVRAVVFYRWIENGGRANQIRGFAYRIRYGWVSTKSVLRDLSHTVLINIKIVQLYRLWILPCYSQTSSSVATRLSFWRLFDKFLISFVNRSISFTCQVYQTQKAWNRSLSTTEFWKNLLLCKKLNLTKIWAGIKFIYRQYAFVSVLAKSRPLPTLKFDKQTCNVFHHMFTLLLKIWLARFKPEAIKLIKNLSKDVKNLARWRRLSAFDCNR